MAQVITLTTCPSPIGPLTLGSIGDSLCLCAFADSDQPLNLSRRIGATMEMGRSDVVDKAMAQLHDYFDGRLRRFTIPMVTYGTEFQELAWQQLLRIPYGQTISYGEEARLIGRPNAQRAVGAANNANRISIFIPCHRVIGANGALVGYGGGLEVKKRLLDLERGINTLPL